MMIQKQSHVSIFAKKCRHSPMEMFKVVKMSKKENLMK